MVRIIRSNQTIGIIGGGQLGRMMAISAKQMGYTVAVLDPTPNCPCAQVADIEITAAYNDLDAIKALAKVSDVITYEFENIDYEALSYLESHAYLPQGSEVLKISQHRWTEKKTISAMGIPVAPFLLITSKEALLEKVHYPTVLKTTTGGYDGKGQVVLRSEADLLPALELCEQQECILEDLIPFEKEVSVIVVRSVTGEVSVLPVAENRHVNNILHESIVPALLSETLNQEARKIGLKIADELKLVGILAIEMFVTKDKIYVNELAPRPHNSGHFSMDACSTGQFEQQIRAICGLPLGQTDLLYPVVMVNILGQHLLDLAQYDSLLSFSKLHLYGKAKAVKNRKMGHINVRVEHDLEETLQKIHDTGIWTDVE